MQPKPLIHADLPTIMYKDVQNHTLVKPTITYFIIRVQCTLTVHFLYHLVKPLIVMLGKHVIQYIIRPK